jgi:hypothetical protein
VPEKIDVELAEKVMEEAVQASRDPATVRSLDFVAWSKRVREFSELCLEKGLKSYIPVLGNALLAKATNPRVDVFSLKARDKSQGAYDARRTAENVLVPASHKHRFSLGTTGAQPLNNQPFFRSIRIDTDLPVRPDAAELRDALLKLLHEIQQLRSEEAVRGLAAFVAVRREYVTKYSITEGKLAIGSGNQLAFAIDAFVSTQSDGGGRAQAAAGGLMDALFAVERVRVGKRNEPDRKMPGDVGIREAADPESPFVRILEVRDKNVPPYGALSFISKVADAGVGRAVLVAMAATQEELSVADLQTRARQAGIDLEVFTDWLALVRSAIFAADVREVAFVESAVAAIRARIIELELPIEAVAEWDSATMRVAVD